MNRASENPGGDLGTERAARASVHASRALLALAFAGTLGVLLAHVYVYRFLTDDAFISFRYASNLANGDGLVFNPGFERVEGYTNFLWVIILAGIQRVFGVAPESAANPLLICFTVALWALIAREALRSRQADEAWWPAVVPIALLALTRSVAVWSTSGLETRLFELLIVGAVFRLLSETRTLLSGGRPFPWSGALLSLATLTRPDGALIAGCALLAACASAGPVWRRAWSTWALQGLLFAVPVTAHALWRHAYYGDWLPNTWYAKVGGLSWWDMGGQYIASFVLEYGVVLWLPLVALAIIRHRRLGTLYVPLIYSAALVPHALYIASIGGDHFEYRPLTLYFPFLFLLIGDGVRETLDLMRRRTLRTSVVAVGAGAYGAVLLLALTWLPWQTHRQYPTRFVPGFPGIRSGAPETARYLDPSRDPILRLPGLGWIANTHRALLYATTARLVGIRAEEHRLFVEATEPTGTRLRELVEEGVLPPDTYIAVSAAGVIPYRSGLRTLDRLGLNDREVARSPVREPRAMGHDHFATVEYAERLDVDLWAEDPVHPLLSIDDERLSTLVDEVRRAGQDAYFAYAGSDVFVVRLPSGAARAAERFPRLSFHSLNTESPQTAELEARIEEAERRRLARNPTSPEARLAAAEAMAQRGDSAAALSAIEALAAADDPHALGALANLYSAQGRNPEAVSALRRAVWIAPNLPGLQFNLGVALSKLNRWEEARAAFEEAAAVEPSDPKVRYGLGGACYVVGDQACTEEQARRLESIRTDTAAVFAKALRDLLVP